MTLLGPSCEVACGVTFCFTERTGGVSPDPWASLNLSLHVGDDPSCVQENRRRVFEALEAPDLLDGVLIPRQVHSDRIMFVSEAMLASQTGVRLGQTDDVDGHDAVVCTCTNQAVMLLFADCTPVVLAGPCGFSVVHSGWRGTLAGIAGKAAHALCQACGCSPLELSAWIGPHISAESYEVSEDLCEAFVGRFGKRACVAQRRLDLGACVQASLEEAGMEASSVFDCMECTVRHVGRFFSHRAEKGHTGRHAAVAFMRPR